MTTSTEIEIRAESAPTGQSALVVIESLPAAIESPEQYTAVTEKGRGLRDLMKEIKTFFMDLKADAHALHQKLCDKEAFELTDPRRGLTMVNKLLDGYDERQKAARAESERLAREERERIEREAREETERLEALAREEREEAERLAAEEPTDQEDERDRLAAIAAAKVKADDLDRAAERARDAPRPATSFAAPVAEVPVVAGTSKSEGWDFEIVDPTKIKVKIVRDAMRVVTEEKIKASWLGQYLRQIVRKHGESVGEIVGEGALKLKRKTTRSYR